MSNKRRWKCRSGNKRTTSGSHALGLYVVAEGVEDEPTYTFLGETGCDIVQGYHVSRPLPEADFTAWLSRTSSQTVNRTADQVTVDG